MSEREIPPEKRFPWTSDPHWNADFLVKCLQVLVNSPAAGAFMKPTLDGRANFMMEQAVTMAEDMAGGILEVALMHTGERIHGRKVL